MARAEAPCQGTLMFWQLPSDEFPGAMIEISATRDGMFGGIRYYGVTHAVRCPNGTQTIGEMRQRVTGALDAWMRWFLYSGAARRP